MCMPGISMSNKKGPNSFSAVFRKLILPNDDLKKSAVLSINNLLKKAKKYR